LLLDTTIRKLRALKNTMHNEKGSIFTTFPL
jgi:hypothetical protein